MKQWLIVALVAVFAASSFPDVAEAKRFGGGGFSGMKRQAPARSTPDAPPAKPATPAQGQQAAPGAAAAAPGAAAAAGKRSWMGPIAGLAAGLGLAALMSHLGLGEAFANFLMLALLAVAAIFLIRFVMRRMSAGRDGAKPAFAGGSGAAGPRATPSWPAASDTPNTLRSAEPAAAPLSGTVAGATTAGAATTAMQPVQQPAPAAAPDDAADDGTPAMASFVPAAFDAEGFSRIAKLIFIRMQAANDAADLDDLRRFTTPEMFAAARLDIQERGPTAQKTDVVRVDADVLDVANTADRQIVSVRFHGLIVEEPGQPAAPFDEVWHLVKPVGDDASWAIAGIEQKTH